MKLQLLKQSANRFLIDEDKIKNRVTNPDGSNKTINFDHRTITAYDENGHRKAYILDGHDRITNVLEYNNDPVLGFNFEVDTYNTTYAYDTADNLVNITDALGNLYTFSYDSLGRRIALSDPDLGNWTYTYDLVGNLITQKQVGGGNLVSGDGFYREYDGLNQLTIIRNGSSANSGQIENYTYDPFGQRIKIMRNDSARTIIYTPFKDFMRIKNTTGTYDFTYIFQDDVLVARVDPKNNKTFYHPDHLGNTVLITNSSGRIVENTFYSPFGEVLGGGKADIKLYTGQMKDFPCEYYYGKRHFAPCLGIFTQPDTIITNIYNPQSLNRYSYALNNPYRYKDDTGQIPIDTVLDVAFMGSDIYTLFTQGVGEDYENLIALGLDIAGTATPYATGFGKIYKTGKAADRAIDTAKVIDKASDTARTVGRNLNKKELDVFKKIDKIKHEQLTGKTLDAARRELKGEVVATKATGDPYDHVTKVQNAQKGLANQIEKLKQSLKDPKLSPETRKTIEEKLSEASKLLDKSEKYVPRGRGR